LNSCQVAGAQDELADEPLAPAGQHGAHVVEVLGPRGPDVRAVLKDPAGLRLLSEQADRELVGVEVPRVL
jgi:hypothetical protein